MSMSIEINKPYEMYELPELVKTLITSSRFVKSGDIAVRYASVLPSVDNVQQERAMNVTLHLALSQMSHVEMTMIDADGGVTLNPSDVVVTARTLFGDNESVYLTITTNQTAELVAAMTVNWSTCTVTLYEHSRREGDKQPDQERKEETMTENTEYVKNDNALAEILAKINSAYGNPDTTVLLKPLDSEGNQITLTHHANMLVGQILGGTMRGRKAECYSAETYNFVEGDLSDRFYVTIGFNRTDLENMDCLNLPKGGVPVVAKYASSYNPQDCVPIVFEGFVDPISGVGYQKVNKKQESQSATASLQELDKKFKEVVMYASEKGFYGTFCVSCAKHGYSQQSQSQAGRMPKSKALWNTLTDMIASLLSLVNDLDGTADIRISTAMTGGEVGIRNQVFSVSNTMPATVTVQQPAFTPNFYNGFHPQNHMPHNQCQPGYMGGVSSAFQPQSGPTVKGFKSQPNS